MTQNAFRAATCLPLVFSLCCIAVADHVSRGGIARQASSLPPAFRSTPEGFLIDTNLRGDGRSGVVLTLGGQSQGGVRMAPPARGSQRGILPTAPKAAPVLAPPPQDDIVKALDEAAVASWLALDLPPIDASEARASPIVDRAERLDLWPAAVGTSISSLKVLGPQLGGALRERRIVANDVQQRLRLLHDEIATRLERAAVAFDRSAELGARVVLAQLRERHEADAKALHREESPARHQLYRARLESLESSILHFTALFDRHAARARVIRSVANELRGLARAHAEDSAEIVNLILTPTVVEKSLPLVVDLLVPIQATQIGQVAVNVPKVTRATP